MLSDEPRPSPWRWWICGVLLLATTLNYVDRFALNLMSKEIKTEFRITDTPYGVLESGFQIAFGLGAICFGVLVDRFGPRRVYPVAVIGWSAAGFLTGYADSYWNLFACRMMLGLFEAGNWPCGIRTLRQVMPRAERSLGNSIFQSGTGLGAILTPLVLFACFAIYSTNAAADWRLPFRAVGIIGLSWLLLWWLTVPKALIDHAPLAPSAPPEPFHAVFRDRRFWLLCIVIIGVNTSWHTYRVWMPLYLRDGLKYDESELRWFSTLYFVVADIGSWLAGFAVLGLKVRGIELHRARLTVFAVGVGFVSASFALPFVSAASIPVLLVAAGFGGLGLFATYFALSQEVSGRNQGKITGTLGCVNSLFLAGLYWVQGNASDYFGGQLNVLATAPIPAILALIVVWWAWPRGR